MARDYDILSILGVPFEETPATLAYDLSSKVSAQVSRILDEKGMTLKELASKMGIAQPTLCKMLGANSNMTMKTVARIALALGYDVEEPRLARRKTVPENGSIRATVILDMPRSEPMKQAAQLNTTIMEA